MAVNLQIATPLKVLPHRKDHATTDIQSNHNASFGANSRLSDEQIRDLAVQVQNQFQGSNLTTQTFILLALMNQAGNR